MQSLQVDTPIPLVSKTARMILTIHYTELGWVVGGARLQHDVVEAHGYGFKCQ